VRFFSKEIFATQTAFANFTSFFSLVKQSGGEAITLFEKKNEGRSLYRLKS